MSKQRVMANGSMRCCCRGPLVGVDLVKAAVAERGGSDARSLYRDVSPAELADVDFLEV